MYKESPGQSQFWKKEGIWTIFEDLNYTMLYITAYGLPYGFWQEVFENLKNYTKRSPELGNLTQGMLFEQA